MSKLIAHVDTNYVDESVVMAIPEPPFTDTWRPIAHGKVIHALQGACEDAGLGITQRYYSMNEKGTRMFGVWDLDYRTNGSCYSLGFRNSIDKSMVVGVVGGFRVFVCDNLALSGEYLQFHKHTSGLDQDRLIKMSKNALTGAWVNMERLESWINNLKTFELSGQDFKMLTYNLMENNVFPSSSFNRFHNSWEEERSPKVFSLDFSGKNTVKYYEKGTDLYTVHGACTRMMRGASLFNVADRNRRLIEVCDDFIEMKRAA